MHPQAASVNPMAGFKLGLLPFLSGLILCVVPKKLVGKICSRDNNDVERIVCAANCQSRKGPN